MSADFSKITSGIKKEELKLLIKLILTTTLPFVAAAHLISFLSSYLGFEFYIFLNLTSVIKWGGGLTWLFINIRAFIKLKQTQNDTVVKSESVKYLALETLKLNKDTIIFYALFVSSAFWLNQFLAGLLIIAASYVLLTAINKRLNIQSAIPASLDLFNDDKFKKSIGIVVIVTLITTFTLGMISGFLSFLFAIFNLFPNPFIIEIRYLINDYIWIIGFSAIFTTLIYAYFNAEIKLQATDTQTDTKQNNITNEAPSWSAPKSEKNYKKERDSKSNRFDYKNKPNRFKKSDDDTDF